MMEEPMRTISLRALPLLLLTFTVAAAEVTTKRLEEQVEAYAAAGNFQGSVLVARDGQPLLNRGFGMANIEWNIPATPDTKFRLGSVTKQFTGMAVLLLEEQGKLAVTDSIRKLIPEAPAAWDKVTIHHLLTHTSGIPSFTGLPDYRKTNALPAPPAETMKRVTGMPLEFEPGARFKYSNTGYTLLGLIVERASGMAYDAFLRKHVLGPLEMHDTGYHHNNVIVPRMAAGYSRGPKGLEPAGHIDMSIPHAAGALYSTTADLLKWDAALRRGALLGKASYEKYFKPEKDGYAYGWVVREQGGMGVQQHGGGIEGFSTVITRVPAEKLLVVALSNLEQSQAGRLATDLTLLALGREAPKPAVRKEVQLPAATLSRYLGVYDFSPAFAITVTLEDGQLVTQATNQPKFPVFAESETRFFLKVVDAAIEFQVDGAGKVTGLVLEQGGKKMPATRR
jgi:CubicO group peptidase (beta-lactamase class C family)